MKDNCRQILNSHSPVIVAEFSQWLAQQASAPTRLLDAIAYSFNAGGKRLRPALVLEAFAACNGGDADRDSAVKAALAIELIHTFSLVHDDLPAMDDDDLRRGQPTNHKVFGEAMAILAGDAMTTLAFELLSELDDPKIATQLIRELSRCSGPCGMIGGQVLDIDGENQSLSLDQLMQIHRMKTGALLTCACRLGAIAARANEPSLHALTQYGQHLGLAFQIIDDVLDLTSTPEQLGKKTQKDADHGKNTYPSLLGLDESRKKAAGEMTLAMDALSILGDCGDNLRLLARLVVERTS